MRLVTTALIGLFLSAPGAQAADPIMVSMIQLIATPRDFDGKRVIVTGVPRIEFEAHGLFLHKEDFDIGLSKNALWLVVPRDKDAEWRTLEGKYVLVEGTFSAENTGHFGMYSGAIRDITRFQEVRLDRESR